MEKHVPKNFLKPLFYFVRPYPFQIGVLVITILISSVLEGLNIVVILGFFDTLLSMNASVTAFAAKTSSSLFKRVIEGFPLQNKLLAAIIIVLVIICVKCFSDFFRRYYTCYASTKIWRDVQHKVFQRFLFADYKFFLDHKEGEIMYLGFTAPATMGISLQYSCEFLAEIIKLIFILCVLFVISFKVSFIIGIFAGFFYLFTHVLSKKVNYYLGKGRQESGVKQSVLLSEMINGIKQIKVFISEKRWIDEYNKAMEKYFKLYIKDEMWKSLPTNMLELLAIALLFVVFGVLKAGQKTLSPESFSILGVYVYSFYRFMPSLKNLSLKRMDYVGNFSIIESLYNFDQSELVTIPDGNIPLESLSKEIRFNSISFSYPGRDAVLKGMSFEIRKGMTVAFVGKSGSGKTTVANLMLRLFVPQRGNITVDDINLADLRRETWLSKIGYVSQETFIFNASIRENIVFGRPFDENKLIEVSRLANAHDFIIESPEKYDTLVGEKGLKLSGGQRQRIAIARAMYGNPEILIFDEATSSLDNVSERIIQNAIKRIACDHTVILIAHRLSTVINADKIIVLEEGRIIEEGAHSQLIERGGRYSALYNKEAVEEGVSQ